MRRRHIILCAVLLLAACSGQYKGLPREEVLSFQTQPTYGELYSLASAYARSINAAVSEDTLHPGMYADYGVALALMGHREAACRMLNAEMVAFPESRGMVARIKQRLLPDMLGDSTARQGERADTALLARWAYDSLGALRPFPGAAPIIDSTDAEWISQQTPVDSVEYPIRLTANQKREMLAQQQAEAERLRQAKADSIANAKQAKIDARKQAKADKAKASKEKAKAKKRAEKEKKRLEKQRKQQRKQEAAAKQKERERAAAERKAARQQERKGGKR